MRGYSNAVSKSYNIDRVCILDPKVNVLLFEEKACLSKCLIKHYEVEKIIAEEMRHLGAEKNTENIVLNPFIK